MNDDFRLKVSFLTHPKTRKLKRRHGDSAVLSLLKLWAFASQHRCKGVLYDMSKDDIVDVSEWPGDSEFVDSLIEIGFLDDMGDYLELHDWKEHNGWAYYAEERAQSAREAANARWSKKHDKSNT